MHASELLIIGHIEPAKIKVRESKQSTALYSQHTNRTQTIEKYPQISH